MMDCCMVWFVCLLPFQNIYVTTSPFLHPKAWLTQVSDNTTSFCIRHPILMGSVYLYSR